MLTPGDAVGRTFGNAVAIEQLNGKRRGGFLRFAGSVGLLLAGKDIVRLQIFQGKHASFHFPGHRGGARLVVVRC